MTGPIWFQQYFISLYTYKYLTIIMINGPGSDSKLKTYTSHFLRLAQFENSLPQMVLGWPSTKLVHIL